MLLNGSIIPSNSAAGGRVEVGHASNTPPPQFDGRNVGGLTRRIRRAGRSSPKQYRNLTGRRVFTLGPMAWFSFRSVIRFSRRDAEAQKITNSDLSDMSANALNLKTRALVSASEESEFTALRLCASRGLAAASQFASLTQPDAFGAGASFGA